MLYIICIYSIFALLLLYGIKKEKAESGDTYLKKLNLLRGFFALEIVIGHVVRYEKSLLYPLGKFMIISVAFFFFVSAMGLLRSWHRKTDYLKHFLLHKGSWLLAIALVAFLYQILWRIITGKPVNGNIFVLFLQNTNWYIWELLIFYFLFYIVYKFSHKHQIAIITVVTMLMTAAAYEAGLAQGYYSSAMAFPAGLLFWEYYDRVTGFLKNRKGILLAAGITVLGLSSLFFGQESFWGMVCLRNIMCLAAICLLFYFSGTFTVDNRAVLWLGKYSLEIYLYQFTFLELTGDMYDFRLRILLVCGITILSALVLHPVNCWMKERIQHL